VCQLLVRISLLQELGRELSDALNVLLYDELHWWPLLDAACHDQRRALHLLDRVNVILDHRIDQRLVEAVRGSDHDVQLCAIYDRKVTGSSECVE